MKQRFVQLLSKNSSFIIGFLLSAVAAFLLVSHFQHTILQAWFGVSSSQASQFGQADAASIVYVDSAEAPPQDLGCGCPFCCSVPGL